MPGDNRVHHSFTFGHQLREISARVYDFLIQPFSFHHALRVKTRRALALARQPFSLQCQTLKRRLKLAANLHQSFGDRRVRQKLCAGTLDLRFGFGDFNDALAVSVFGRLKHERVIFTCRAQFRIMLTQTLAFLFDIRQTLAYRLNFSFNLSASFAKRLDLLLLIALLARAAITLQLRFGCCRASLRQLFFDRARFLRRTARILFTRG